LIKQDKIYKQDLG